MAREAGGAGNKGSRPTIGQPKGVKVLDWGGVKLTVAPDTSRGGNNYVIILPGGERLPVGSRLNSAKKTIDLPNGRHLSFTGGRIIQNTPVANRDKVAKKTYTQTEYGTGRPISGQRDTKPAPRSGDDQRQATPTPAARPAAAPTRPAAAPAAAGAAPAGVGTRGTSAPAPRSAGGAPAGGGGATFSGGGVAARPTTTAPAAKPGAPASTKGTDAQVRSMFGAEMAAFLTEPELGPILRKAAAEGWDQTRLAGALQQTRFWRTKGNDERKWFILNRLDNATARRQVEQTAQGIWDMARQTGLNLSGLQVHDLAVNALKFGWSPSEIREQSFRVMTGKPGSLDTAVATQYGYLAAFLDNPEVGPLLERAAREGWTEQRLEVELQKTNFWKTTTDSARRFSAAQEQDPATAEGMISQRRSDLLTIAQSLGVTLDPAKLTQIATDSLKFGWNDSQTRRAITAEFDYQGGESGVAGQTSREIKSTAAQYLVPISDQAMEQWTEKIVRGEVDMEGFNAYLVETAKSMFPGMAGALDRGITVAQYADPYKQMAARELELNPESIDLMDPRFRKMLDQTDAKGNRVSMTLSESAEYLRKLPEWQQTRGANEKAAALTENILRTFGAVA